MKWFRFLRSSRTRNQNHRQDRFHNQKLNKLRNQFNLKLIRKPSKHQGTSLRKRKITELTELDIKFVELYVKLKLIKNNNLTE